VGQSARGRVDVGVLPTLQAFVSCWFLSVDELLRLVRVTAWLEVGYVSCLMASHSAQGIPGYRVGGRALDSGLTSRDPLWRATSCWCPKVESGLVLVDSPSSGAAFHQNLVGKPTCVSAAVTAVTAAGAGQHATWVCSNLVCRAWNTLGGWDAGVHVSASACKDLWVWGLHRGWLELGSGNQQCFGLPECWELINIRRDKLRVPESM
jgi:hypothetical protein